MVITQSLAGAFWPGENALGRCMVWETEEVPDPPCTTVVGVVENFRRQEISERSPHFGYFLNQGHYVFRGPAQAIMVRTNGEVAASVDDVRRAVGSTSPEIRYPVVTPLMDAIEPHLRSFRLGASMFSLFGLLALVVAGEKAPNEKELISFVKGFVDSGRLSRHALMLKVMVVDEIDKTSVGKIDKKLLRQKHLLT